MATRGNFQFRLYIGPRITSPDNGTHYDWSVLDFDGTDAINYSTTLASGMSNSDTSATLTSGTNFPTEGGGLWVGPNGSGQGWEYMDYSARSGTSVTGIARDSITYQQHNMVHTAGASVYFWYPVASNNGEMEFSWQLTKNLSASYWTCKMHGVTAPQAALRNEHLVLVQYRTSFTGTWQHFLLGTLANAKISDDFRELATWEFDIFSAHGLLSIQELKGVRVGDLDVAQYGQATSSVVLGSAFKQYGSDDYVSSEPDLSAGSAIDGNNETLWVADTFVGTERPIGSWDGVSQVYINPHPGRGPAYKWIELTNFSTASEKLAVFDPTTNLEYLMDFEDVSSLDDYYVILTSDPVTFARENPSYNGDMTVIVDITTLGEGSTFLDHCLPEGGAIAIKGLSSYRNGIRWGTCAQFPDGSTSGYDGADWDYNDNWTGSGLTAPEYGQTIRLLHDVTPVTNNDERWETGYVSSPGYTIKSDGDDAWIYVQLPSMGLVLRDDIDNTDTTIYVVDGSGQASTDGLDASGSIVVGTETITYTAKASDSLTGCTVAEEHAAGDRIYAVENGIATDAMPIDTIGWERYGGVAYPEDFDVRWSRVVSRMPSQSEHETDYASPYGGITSVTGHAASTYSLSTSAGARRIKTILIEFKMMTPAVPARPRLNRLYANLYTSLYDSDLWMADTATPNQVIERLCENAGMPTDAATAASSALTAGNVTTGADFAWAVIQDFAEFAGAFAHMGRTSQITAWDNELWSTAINSYTADASWSRSNLISAEKIFRRANHISQVRMAWQTPDGSDSGTEVYPSGAAWMGGVLETETKLFANATAAQLAARKTYWINKYPYTVLMTADDIDLTIYPGQWHELTWQFQEDAGEMVRLYLVTAIDYRVAGGHAEMTLSGLQIDREVTW